MENRLFLNLCSNIVAFTCTIFISFFITPYIIESVGKEAYSFFPISNSILGYFSIASLALNSMMARFITIEREKGNIKKAQAFFSSGFYANIIMAMVFIFPMTLFVLNVDIILNVPKDIAKDVKLLFLYVFLAMLIGLASTAYGVSTFAANRLDLRALGELIRGFLRITLFLGLFYFLKPTLSILGLVSLILSIYLFLYQKYLTSRLTPELFISLSHFDFASVKTLLFSGSWNVVNAIGISLLFSMTLILTNKFIGVSAGGEVAVATILPTFIGSIITMIVSVLLPRLIQLYASEDENNFNDELIFSQKLLSLLTTTPILILFFLGDDFFRIWIPTSYTENVFQLSKILLIPLFVHANMWTVYNYNIITNRLRQPSLVLLIFGVIFVFISFIYIGFLGGSVFFIPMITAALSVLYYLFYIPCYVVSYSSLTYFDIYFNIFKSGIFIFTYIGMLNLFIRGVIVDGWVDLLLLFGVLSAIGILLHALFLFSKCDFVKMKFKLIKLR